MPKDKEYNFKVNLLPRTEFEKTQIGKFLSWTLTTGKSIVFLTFSIVVFGFLYRFQLDKQIEVFTDDIKSDINQVRQLQEEETVIRGVQAKLDFSQELLMELPDISEILRNVENSLPVQSYLSSIELNRNQLTIVGKADNEITFSSLLTALQEQAIFQEIVIDSLRSGGVVDPTISFIITLTVSSPSSREAQ
jgi:Tfp pilus assembly protein PilN